MVTFMKRKIVIVKERDPDFLFCLIDAREMAETRKRWKTILYILGKFLLQFLSSPHKKNNEADIKKYS